MFEWVLNTPVQIILVNILTRVKNLMIKRIPRGWNIFTRKNKRCYDSLPKPCIRPSLSRGHQTVAIMNHYIEICISYCTVSSTMWSIFSEVLIFCWLRSRVSKGVNNRNEESFGHIVRGKHVITSLLLMCKISTVC